jgi:hypothetical protein
MTLSRQVRISFPPKHSVLRTSQDHKRMDGSRLRSVSIALRKSDHPEFRSNIVILIAYDTSSGGLHMSGKVDIERLEI